MKDAICAVLFITVALLISVARAETPDPVSEFKPPDSDEVTHRRNTIIGHWFEESPLKEGGKRLVLATLEADGTYKVQFRKIYPSGTTEDSTEVGLWGVSGPIHFTIMMGWVKDLEFVPA